MAGLASGTTVKCCLAGALGAMGQVLSGMAGAKGVEILAGFDKVEAPSPYGFTVYKTLSAMGSAAPGADLVIDFSHHSVADEVAAFCVERNIGLVCATTGLSATQEQGLRDAAKGIPVFRSANFSYGISVLRSLAAQAARLLAADFDIEVIEAHHNKKQDSPSGTAKLLVESIEAGAGKPFDVLYGRPENASHARVPSELAVHSLRGGAIAGTHEAVFAGAGEVIRISHEALSKQVFGTGALKAALFLAGKPAGYYTMDDILTEGQAGQERQEG